MHRHLEVGNIIIEHIMTFLHHTSYVCISVLHLNRAPSWVYALHHRKMAHLVLSSVYTPLHTCVHDSHVYDSAMCGEDLLLRPHRSALWPAIDTHSRFTTCSFRVRPRFACFMPFQARERYSGYDGDSEYAVLTRNL
jgi:hypothetical protein